MQNFWLRGRPCGTEHGFLLVLLLPLLALFTLFFGASLDSILKAQEREALQSRLDVCAVRLAVGRERALERLAGWNSAIRITKGSLYAMRATMAVTGPAGIAAMEAGEEALLETNHAMARLQDGALAVAAGKELLQMLCAPTPFSKTLAHCTASPSLSLSLQRESTLFADVEGPLVHKRESSELAAIHCRGTPSSGLSLHTQLRILGDSSLRNKTFADDYVQ